MKEYYNGLRKLQDFNHLSTLQLQTYSWHQKREVSAQLDLLPDFWVIVDYAVSLTKRILKQNKVAAETDIQNILRPLFEQYNTKISRTYDKLSEKNHFFLKNELKTFHHIVTHTINLIDKRMAYLTPSYLFVSSIEHMKMLAPAGEHCCDPRTLAEKKFSTLFSRHLASQYSQSLVDIIDNLLWQYHIKKYLLPDDIARFNRTLVDKLTVAINEEIHFDNSSDYRVEQLIIELKKVVNISLIKQKLEEILKEISSIPAETLIDSRHYLDKIVELFISSKTDATTRFVLRDLTILSRMMQKIKTAILEKDRDTVHYQLTLGLALKPMVVNVISHLTPPTTGMKMCASFELISALNNSFPSLSAAEPYMLLIDDLIITFEKEKTNMEKFSNTTITEEEIELYIDKTMSKITL